MESGAHVYLDIVYFGNNGNNEKLQMEQYFVGIISRNDGRRREWEMGDGTKIRLLYQMQWIDMCLQYFVNFSLFRYLVIQSAIFPFCFLFLLFFYFLW